MGKILKTMCLLLAVLLALGWKPQKQLRGEATRRERNRQAEAVELAVEELAPEQLALQKNLAKWYNYNLELGTQGLEGAYETILNFGEGRMGVLGVPEWELRMAIFHGSGGVVNHAPVTALPLGSREDHTVLYLGEDFPWEEGLSLYIDCLGQRLTYRVESIRVTDGKEMWGQEENPLTLVYDRGNTRTLIRCVRCGDLVLRQGELGAHFPWAAPAAALPALILLWIWRGNGSDKRERKRKNWGFCRKNREKTKLS